MGKIFPANLNRYDPYKTYRFRLAGKILPIWSS